MEILQIQTHVAFAKIRKFVTKVTLDSAHFIDPIKCKDGYSFSLQASRTHYCSPRKDTGLHDDFIFTAFQIGLPSEADDLLNEYAEDGENPTETVYGYVPAEVVQNLVDKHGGIS